MNVKMIVSSVIVAVGLIAAPGAANAQEALAKSSGCMNCHDVSAKKMGPAFKEIATKYKGKADAAATVEAKLTGPRDIRPSRQARTTSRRWSNGCWRCDLQLLPRSEKSRRKPAFQFHRE